MARFAATVAELGVGDHDGEMAFVQAGDERIRLKWLEPEALWIGQAQLTVTFCDFEAIALSDTEATWRYMSSSLSNNDPRFASHWAPRAIRGALSAYDAGLTLQEKLDADFWIWDAGGDYDIAIVYYSMDDGGSIDPGISPDESSPGRNVGTRMPGVPTVRCMTSTGWVDCPIDAPTEENLAPHMYSYCNDNASLGGSRVERFASYVRWVGNPAV